MLRLLSTEDKETRSNAFGKGTDEPGRSHSRKDRAAAASASLAYSRLNARAFEEGMRMKPVVKLGLSRRGLAKVCRSVSLRILAVPLAVALAHLWAGIAAVALSTDAEIIVPAVGSTLVALAAGFACCALAAASYTSSVQDAASGAKAR